jgi:uncharacterized membrane protein
MKKTVLLALVIGLYSWHGTHAQYTNLGSQITPTAMNYNGTTVVGDNGGEHFMWQDQTGVVLIGGVGPQGYGGQTGISSDGTIISGTRINPNTGLGELSLYDVDTETWTSLGGIGGSSGSSTSSAWGISHDGSSIVGLGWVNAGSAHAIQWTAATGMVDLGSTVSGSSSRANACNGDGSIVVGWQDSTTGFRQAAVWTNGVQELLTFPNNAPASEAGCVNFDGTFIGGSGNDNNNYQAWRYNSNTGMENIGPAPVNGWRGATTDLSDDGSVVVGFYRPWPAPATMGQGFIYKDGVGLTDLNQVATDLGIDTQGRTLALPLAVSGDGTTVAGVANDGTGFIIRLSESFAINDQCSNAIFMSCNSVEQGSTTNATDSGGNGTNDVFYKFVGDGEAQLVTASLCANTNFDTVIRVYDNCDLTNEIASNDDACGVQSAVTFESDGVSSYFIMVEGTNGSGDFEITIDCENLMGLDGNAFQNFSIAPNPADDQVVLRNTVALERIVLHNIMGQRLEVIESNNLEQRLSVGHLAPGVYLVTVEIQGAKHTVPVVKQ